MPKQIISSLEINQFPKTIKMNQYNYSTFQIEIYLYALKKTIIFQKLGYFVRLNKKIQNLHQKRSDFKLFMI